MHLTIVLLISIGGVRVRRALLALAGGLAAPSRIRLCCPTSTFGLGFGCRVLGGGLGVDFFILGGSGWRNFQKEGWLRHRIIGAGLVGWRASPDGLWLLHW
jgi:hypothetical protein